jgi:F0F1-type ATP synthase assembly protein I
VTESKAPKAPRSSLAEALALAGNMGFTIAVPLVGFALLGRMLDRRLDSHPWFLLAGLLLAVSTSTFILIRKFSRLLNK